MHFICSDLRSYCRFCCSAPHCSKSGRRKSRCQCSGPRDECWGRMCSGSVADLCLAHGHISGDGQEEGKTASSSFDRIGRHLGTLVCCKWKELKTVSFYTSTGEAHGAKRLFHLSSVFLLSLMIILSICLSLTNVSYMSSSIKCRILGGNFIVLYDALLFIFAHRLQIWLYLISLILLQYELSKISIISILRTSSQS